MVDHRPDVDRRVQRVAGLQAVDLLHEPRHELVVDLGLHEHPLDADARLPGLVVAAERQARRGEVEVGVAVDDHAGVAAELERHVLVRVERLQLPADPEPGERELREPPVLDQRLRARPAGSCSTDSIPSGRSVSSTSSASSSEPSGVCPAGLITIGAPTASAGAILCATRFTGKLNGVMPMTGPEREPPQDRRAAASRPRCRATGTRRPRGAPPRPPTGTSTTARVASTFAHFSGLPPSRAMPRRTRRRALADPARDRASSASARAWVGRGATRSNVVDGRRDGVLDVGVGRDADLGDHAVVVRAADLEGSLARPPLAGHVERLRRHRASPPRDSSASAPGWPGRSRCRCLRRLSRATPSRA